jgi:membrane protein DedA with SNARE-associated domain
MNIDIAGLAHGAAAVGYPLLFALVLAASAGAPLPIGVLLAGLGAASIHEGGPNFALLAASGLAASVAGDGIDFGIGRLGGRRALLWAMARLRRNRPLAALARVGPPPKQGLLLFLSRFALTPIAMPVSLLAGATGLGIGAFLFWDVAGEGLFVVGNLAVGRVLFADGLSDDGLLIALGVLAVLSYAGIWAATHYITYHQRSTLQSAAAEAPAQPSVRGVELSRWSERIAPEEPDRRHLHHNPPNARSTSYSVGQAHARMGACDSPAYTASGVYSGRQPPRHHDLIRKEPVQQCNRRVGPTVMLRSTRPS